MNIRVITFYFNNVDVVAVRIFPRREGSGESLTESPHSHRDSEPKPAIAYLQTPL